MTATATRRVAIPTALAMPRAAPDDGCVQELAGESMGTTWSVKFVGSRASRQMLQRIIPLALARVVAQMSPWETDSDLSRFNRLAPKAWQTLPPEFAQVIAAALRIAAESDGAYDPTVGALVDLWGFGPSGPRPAPPADAIARLHRACGFQQLRFDPARRRLCRHDTGPLDLCGIAKGFAVDLVMERLREYGIHHALVEIGGELSGSGIKPDGHPWWVEIDQPATDGAVTAPMLIALHGLAVATSGCERGFARDARYFSHTLDPRTGYPIVNGMVTATVLHRSCMEADAYATALMVLGPERAIDFAAARELAALIRFTGADGLITERATPALEAMLA